MGLMGRRSWGLWVVLDRLRNLEVKKNIYILFLSVNLSEEVDDEMKIMYIPNEFTR